MYYRTEGDQFIMDMPDKEVLINEIHNGFYYHVLEDLYLVIVNTVEEKREGLFRIELKEAREARQALAMSGYLSHKL